MNATGASTKEQLGPYVKGSVFSSVLDSTSLPPEEKSLLRLEQEGALAALAGTRSPAFSLSTIFYHLIANPAILTRLPKELSTLPESTTWTELEQLPYLSAVLEEGNRLSFGVTARTARIAHEPLLYAPTTHVATSSKKSYTIPPGTPVSITSLAAHTGESVFPDPYKFDPKRWLGDEGRQRKSLQMAFGKGGLKCIGIELANAELYLLTAELVRHFDMSLYETDESDIGFFHDWQVAHPKLDSKGIRVMANSL